MHRVIAEHKYKNGKAIQLGITDAAPDPRVDPFFLRFRAKRKRDTTIYLRPDEVVLLSKLSAELILKRIVGYEVNLGRKTSKDY